MVLTTNIESRMEKYKKENSSPVARGRDRVPKNIQEKILGKIILETCAHFIKLFFWGEP